MMELQNNGLSEDTLEKNVKNMDDISSVGNKENKSHRPTQFSVEYMDPDTICGIGRFQPQWLQKYATSKSFLILYSVVGIIQGMYYTTLIGSMTTLEKRYAFKSKTSGAIMMVDEITPLLLGTVVGYFGGRLHKPRVLAVGMYMSALCCIITALPYFVYGPARNLVTDAVKNETSTEYCDSIAKHESCEEEDRQTTIMPVVCLFIGSFLKGFGSIAYYAVGLSYMDDVTKRKNTPLYFAISAACRLIGPILGFLVASAFLNYYENPFDDPGYGPDDARWIGAWWLSFVLEGVVLAVMTFPILLFPKRLPKQKVRSLSNTANFKLESHKERFMGMIYALKRLFTNPFYTILVITTLFGDIGRGGIYVMIPKYMEVQFHLSSSEASLFSGPPALVVTQCLIILGGFIIWKFRLSAKFLLTVQVFIQLVWAFAMLILILPSCVHYDMSGTTVTEYGLDIQNECNNHCLCSTSEFSPVCGPDGVSNYFSPCHAGCATQEDSNEMQISNCACVYNTTTGDPLSSNATVTRGLCKAEGCRNQAVIYNVLFSIMAALPNTLVVAEAMILLRCVEPGDKSIALGVFEAMLSAFAAIPYPMIFGALADASCLIWEKSCGETGNCWFYDIDKFSYLMHGCSMTFTLLGTIGYTIIVFMSHRVRDLYKDEDEIGIENLDTEDEERSKLKKRILPTLNSCFKKQS